MTSVTTRSSSRSIATDTSLAPALDPATAHVHISTPAPAHVPVLAQVLTPPVAAPPGGSGGGG